MSFPESNGIIETRHQAPWRRSGASGSSGASDAQRSQVGSAETS